MMRRAFIATVAIFIAWLMVGQETVPLETLKGKRVLLCGASTGIGRSMAVAYARYGAEIVLSARSKEKLEEVAQECRALGATAHVVTADFGKEEDSVALVQAAVEKMGGLDVLVLNHIRPFFGEFMKTDFPTIKNLVDVNLISYMKLTQLALPHLLASKGNIVAVSSVAGKMGIPYVAPYSGTKHALHGFFDSLRLELDLSVPDHGVGITTNIIGNIDTESAKEVTKGHLKTLPRASPDDCALAIIQGGLDRKREVYFPFSDTLPGVVLKSFCPQLLEWMVKKTVG